MRGFTPQCKSGVRNSNKLSSIVILITNKETTDSSKQNLLRPVREAVMTTSQQEKWIQREQNTV